MKKVGIIGGSTFIGSYITQQFLYHGYEAKVSVTDITRNDKYQHLNTFKNSENLQISELNVEDKEALGVFISDCDIVIHGETYKVSDISLMRNNKEPKEKPMVIYKNDLAKRERDLKAAFRPAKKTLNAYSA